MKSRSSNRLILILPFDELIHDLEPTENICRRFRIRPKKLIEHLIVEWMRYQKRQGQYHIVDMFDMPESAVLDFIKSIYIDDGVRLEDREVADIDRIIDLIGRDVFTFLKIYIDRFELDETAFSKLEVIEWLGNNLVVKCQ